MDEAKIWKRIKILSVIGILLASYLFYNYATRNPYQPCHINSWINCYPTTLGNLAELYGIPVSLIGLVGYITILASAFIKNKKLLLAMTAFGMLFCLRLTFLEIFVERIICPVCVACQIIMAVLLYYAVRFMGKKVELTEKGN